ncbi:hypothetical protein [Massilia sp. 9I]|uniref:hypothetical protein n=1 Tax=Massilia sp. 9I TaxID=2653152 RepID=UPI0012F08035|nr:hypothetical protein [Massilia sp. 9I]VXB95320.1 conserved membrane hypothetical protein [Massilia sp. 9I]
MGNWPALILAPSLALVNLSISYALVPPSCAHQNTVALHLVSAAILLLCILFSWQAWRNWRAARVALPSDSDRRAQRPPFVAMVAMMVGALSSLAVLAQWFPSWILSPCAN